MFENEKISTKSSKPGSGSHKCCVTDCQNPGTVALGSIRPGPQTGWKCSYHAWGRHPEHIKRDWRDILCESRILGN